MFCFSAVTCILGMIGTRKKYQKHLASLLDFADILELEYYRSPDSHSLPAYKNQLKDLIQLAQMNLDQVERLVSQIDSNQRFTKSFCLSVISAIRKDIKLCMLELQCKEPC